MSDDINFNELDRIYTEAVMGERKDPIVRYEIDDQGVVHYFTESGAWAGMSDKKALDAFIAKAKEEQEP